MLRALSRWGRRIDAALSFIEIAVVGTAMALASLLLFANVVLRYVFLSPISWAEEVSIYLVIWIVFIGASAIVRQRGHLAIDLLPRSLRPAQRRMLMIIVILLNLVFFAVFLYYSGLHTLRVYASGQVTPNLQAPMWLTYLAMPVGSAFMFLRSAQMLWQIVLNDSAAEVELRVQE